MSVSFIVSVLCLAYEVVSVRVLHKYHPPKVSVRRMGAGLGRQAGRIINTTLIRLCERMSAFSHGLLAQRQGAK